MYSRASLLLHKGSVIEHTHSLNAVQLEVLEPGLQTWREKCFIEANTQPNDEETKDKNT